MKLVYEPTVRLMSMNLLVINQLDAFLSEYGYENWWPDDVASPESLPEVAGRLCYMSFGNPRPGGNAAYLDHIIDVGHHSVLEHAVLGFLIEGVSRALSHELVRHRVGMSYSQLSQRFVDASDVAFVVPPLLIAEVQNVVAAHKAAHPMVDPECVWLTETVNSIGFNWLQSMHRAQRLYASLVKRLEDHDTTLSRKQVREAARSVLPNAAETKIFVTGNARSWRHFITLRMHPDADAEIQRLATAIWSELCNVAPNLFKDLRHGPSSTGE